MLIRCIFIPHECAVYIICVCVSGMRVHYIYMDCASVCYIYIYIYIITCVVLVYCICIIYVYIGHVLNMSKSCIYAVGDTYVCVFTCSILSVLHKLRWHKCTYVLSHVVCCVSYMYGVVLCGVCMLLNAVCALCGMRFLSASSVLALPISEHALPGSTEKSAHPMTAISMSQGRDAAYEIPSVECLWGHTVRLKKCCS